MSSKVDQYQNKGEGLGLSITFMFIATLSVVLRFYCRAIKKTKLGPDDWLIIPSLLLFYGFCAGIIWLAIASVQGGFGLNPALMSAPDLVVFAKVQYMGSFFSVLTISFAKLSILCLYYKIFISQTFRRWVVGVGTSVLIWAITCGLVTLLHCTPPAKLWNPKLHGSCIDFVLFFEIIEPINCAQDIIISVMPIFIIQRLHLNLRQKVFLSLIFLLGNFVSAISLVRIVLVVRPNAAPNALHTSTRFLLAQLFVAIVCANALVYRPLLPEHFIPTRIADWYGSLLTRASREASISNSQRSGWSGGSKRYNNLSNNRVNATSLPQPPNGSFHEETEYPLTAITVSRMVDVA